MVDGEEGDDSGEGSGSTDMCDGDGDARALVDEAGELRGRVKHWQFFVIVWLSVVFVKSVDELRKDVPKRRGDIAFFFVDPRIT